MYGVEIALTSRNIVHRNFKWTNDFTRNKEEITKLVNNRDTVQMKLISTFIVHTIFLFFIRN